MCSYNDASAKRGKRKVLQAAFEFLWLSCHKPALPCFSLYQGRVKGQHGLGQHQNCSVQPHRKEAPLDPSPGSLCWECRELKPSGNTFHSLQLHLCFTVRKSSQTLTDWPLPTQILICDVCPHQVNVVNTVLLTSAWEMGGIRSQKCCFSKSQITRMFIL